MGKYTDLAEKIGKLVDDKNTAYGNSFELAGDFLKLLYPNGIPVSAYTDALCIVRIFDKLKRLSNANNLPANEGKVDAWKDIIGYGLLGLNKDSVTDKVENTDVSFVQKTPDPRVTKKEIIPAPSTPVSHRCALCGQEVEGPIPEEEIKAGKTLVHADCYNKYTKEQKAKSE